MFFVAKPLSLVSADNGGEAGLKAVLESAHGRRFIENSANDVSCILHSCFVLFFLMQHHGVTIIFRSYGCWCFFWNSRNELLLEVII